MALGVEEQVARLHVAVDDPLLVDGVERGRDRRQPRVDLGGGHRRAAGLHAVAEAPSGQVLEDRVRHAADRARVEDLHDARVFSRDQALDLPREALEEAPLREEFRVRHLDDDRPGEALVRREVDGGHAPLAEGPHYEVAPVERRPHQIQAKRRVVDRGTTGCLCHAALPPIAPKPPGTAPCRVYRPRALRPSVFARGLPPPTGAVGFGGDGRGAALL